MKKGLIFLIGNVGSGKSTFCKQYRFWLNSVVVSKDKIRYALGAGEYIFDLKCEKAIHKTTSTLIEALMQQKQNIIIDETNMDRKTRRQYIKLAKKYNYETHAIIFPFLSQKESVSRRLKNNHGNTPKKVWQEVFKRKKEAYQRPTNKEGFDLIYTI